MENLINFAKVNPWSFGLTCLSLVVFVITLFLLNGKDGNTKGAKLNIIGLNIFMIFMIGVIVGIFYVIKSNTDFTTLIDKTDDAAVIYWVSIAALWGFVKYMTGIDPENILNIGKKPGLSRFFFLSFINFFDLISYHSSFLKFLHIYGLLFTYIYDTKNHKLNFIGNSHLR